MRRGCAAPRGVRQQDVELHIIRAIARPLGSVTAPALDALVSVVMRPLTEHDVRVLRTVIRQLSALDPKSADRVRRWLSDRFAPTASTAAPRPWSRPS
jgi:hypothetical protein